MSTLTQTDGKTTDEQNRLSADPSVRLPARIDSMLGRMRRRIRAYVWLEGIAVSVLWLGLAFWGYLLIDWLIEPAWPVRMIAMSGVTVVLATIVFRLILRRAFVSLTNANMALLLERQFGLFNDRLVTTVEMAGHPDHARQFSSEMLSHTTDQVLDMSKKMRLSQAFNLAPLLWRVTAAVVLAGTVALFATLAPNAFGFYWERLTGSPEPWPRDTLLQVDGFATQFAIIVEGNNSTGPSESDQVHVIRGTVHVDRSGQHQISQTLSAGHSITTAPGEAGKFMPLAPLTIAQVCRGISGLGAISVADDTEGLVALRRVRSGLLQSADAEIESGQWLPKTPCQLTEGTAELMFNNGVVVVVEGPAEFQIRSSTRMFLAYGRIGVTAPTRASEFMVDLPTATVRARRNDTIKVVRGSDVEIIARAYALKAIPELVQLRYRSATGGNGVEVMQRQSTAIPGRDQFQDYRYTFKNVLSSTNFSVSGGDDRITNLNIEVIDSPRFLESKVFCQFPDYLVDKASGRFTSREQQASGATELPEGTHVTIRVKANTSVRKIHVRYSDARDPLVVILPTDRKDPSRFEFEFGILRRHTTLLFTMFDEDDISNREPIPIQLTAIPDEPPNVEVRLHGVGAAITPDARVMIAGQLSDDHGLARAWYSLAVGEQEPTEHPLRETLDNRRIVRFDSHSAITDGKVSDNHRGGQQSALDLKQLRLLSDFKLSPGDHIQLSVKATDRCSLGQSPNVGEGDLHYLEIVTPEDLLSRLESRELILRQKFETTMAELEQTRDRLADPVFTQSIPASPAPEETPGSEEKNARRTAPGNASATAQRASQNSERSAYETASIASAFLEIRDELMTNRIDTPQRKQRLEQQIALPLQRIANEMFPKLHQRIDLLRTRVVLENQVARDRAELQGTTAPDKGAEKNEPPPLLTKIAQAEAKLGPMQSTSRLAQECREEADAILAEMNAVLSKMLELEDYNRIVEILRELIDRQEDLNKKTKKKQLQDLGLGL